MANGSRLVAIDPNTRGSLEEIGHEQRSGAEQMLAVVHQEQQVLVPQVGDQEDPWLGRRLVAQVQGRQHGAGDESRVANVGELHHPCSVPEAAPEVRARPDREAGLAHAARTDEGDQTGRGERRPDLRDLAAATDEARRLGWQVPRATDGPGHGESTVLPARAAVSVDSLSNHELHRCWLRSALPRWGASRGRSETTTLTPALNGG